MQIFYGDESGRESGATGSDRHQGTRSDMNWGVIDAGAPFEVLAHWRKLGQFRERHTAIGAGVHQRLSQSPYVFSRQTANDRALVVFAKE